jgi:hypothetical protein
MESVYLGGGTALALHLGHRISAHLDFFVPRNLEFRTLTSDILDFRMKATMISQTPSHCELIIEAIKVDYLREWIAPRFPLQRVVSEGEIFKMADPADIGRMKLHAIADRGSKKDFIDLYCLTRTLIPLEKLLMLAMEEQGTVRFNRLLFLKGLIDFEEAEKDAEPIVLWSIDWSKIKAELTEEVQRIGRQLS